MSKECNIVDYASVSYKEFNVLKDNFNKLSEAVSKTMDCNLTLIKKVGDLQDDALLNAKDIKFLKEEFESLWEYLEKMSNHIRELERSKKGFIRRFFDKFRLIKHDDLDIKKHKSKQKFTLNDD